MIGNYKVFHLPMLLVNLLGAAIMALGLRGDTHEILAD